MNLRTLFAAALCGTLAIAATAQTKRPMTFADLQAMKRVSDPQISASGKWVLFSVTEVDLDKNAKHNHLWAVPLAGGKETQLTSGSGETNGRFSPDGKWIMYSSNETGSGQIWIAPFDDATGTVAAAHAVTALETEADNAIWAPDSHHILFTSEVYPDCESKAPLGPQRNDEEANCNALKDSIEAKNQVKAHVFTELLYRHWDHYQGDKRSHIFYVSIDGTHENPTDITPMSVIGDHVAPTYFVGGGLQGFTISPDGKEIAYVVNLDPVPAESTNNDIFTLAVGADPHTAKKVSTSPGSDDGPQYSPDGKYLAWRSQARNGYESDKFDLVVMDRGTSTLTNLTSKFENWVDEFAWTPNSKSLFFAAPHEGTEQIYQYSIADNTLSMRTDGTRGFEVSSESDEFRDLTHLQGAEFGSLVISPDGKALIASMMSARAPAEIIKAKIDDREEIDDTAHTIERKVFSGKNVRYVIFQEARVSHVNDALLAALDLPRMEEFWFPGANGTKVEGFLIKPPNFDASQKYPVKFLIHGGPQGAWGDAWSYRWNPELFAADGYVVVMVNPRGSTGYGQKFLEEVSGDWGGRPYIDLMKGLDYAEQHFSFIDKDRECALGASYGGFMADWVLTHTNRFKCIVTHDGMYNPQSAFGTTEEDWFNQWEFRPLAGVGPDAVVEQSKPAHPWDFYDKPVSEDPFRKWSPMLSIKNAKTPTLVIHGQRDYRLDVSEGLQLFDSLQMLHVPSKMIYFENEGHWVLKPKDSEFWYSQVNDWVDMWLGMGRYKTVGPAKNPLAAPTVPMVGHIAGNGGR